MILLLYYRHNIMNECLIDNPELSHILRDLQKYSDLIIINVHEGVLFKKLDYMLNSYPVVDITIEIVQNILNLSSHITYECMSIMMNKYQ